jgi:hypothetical protein
MKWSRGISGVSIMFNRLKAYLALFVLVALVLSAIAGLALSEDWGSYQPAHFLGSGENDWWTTYPSQHANAGSSVEHPSSILDALKEKPVLILVHSSNCSSCVEQIANIKKVLESYGGELKYEDVMAEGSGLQGAIALLDIYNPTGGPQYVPTTIFITLIKGSDGKVDVAWHSVEDAVSVDQISAYVKDSIYYYQQNAASWR